MNKRSILLAAIILSAILISATSSTASACGYDGFYTGFGYEQLFMYTPQDARQAGGNTGPRISFGPGYGADVLFGYDFCGTRWGIQFPLEYSRLRLNRQEWVNFFAGSVEAVFRIKQWSNGLDFHLVGGLGGSYMSEGNVQDNSRSPGLMLSAGPGVTYIFSRSEKVKAGVTAELPIRWQYFIGDHLAIGGTSALAIPIRLSLQLGF